MGMKETCLKKIGTARLLSRYLSKPQYKPTNPRHLISEAFLSTVLNSSGNLINRASVFTGPIANDLFVFRDTKLTGPQRFSGVIQ